VARTIAYWVVTVLLALGYFAGSVADLAQPEPVVTAAAKLGYPLTFFSILGVWKVLGAVVILLPRLPRAKEWAYAGFVINLTGALVVHQSVGDPPGDFVAPAVFLALVVASWALRPASRRLPGPWV
jgi:uncharacterized membrane protein YphA (DoxX/SURF4 family)